MIARSNLRRAMPGLVLAGVLLSACNPVMDRREQLMREGDWGWSNGQGCAGRADVWAIGEQWIEMYRDGRLVDRGLLESRRLLHDNYRTSGEGAVEYVEFTYIGRLSLQTQELGRIETVMAIRGGPGRPTALVPRNHRQYTAPETREERREEEPRGGDRLVHCEDVTASD
jgi:hypothetical protein